VERRDVTLKVFNSDSLTPDLVQRFEQEAKALTEFQHLYAVTAQAFGHTEEGHPYVVMELFIGTPLSHDENPAHHRRALNWMQQLCAALAAAHEKGIVHGNITAQNIRLSTDTSGREVVKLVNFEVMKESKSLPEADVYALAVVLSEALKNAAIPDAVQRVLNKALSAQPAERYTSAQQFSEALSLAAKQQQITEPNQPVTPVEQLQKLLKNETNQPEEKAASGGDIATGLAVFCALILLCTAPLWFNKLAPAPAPAPAAAPAAVVTATPPPQSEPLSTVPDAVDDEAFNKVYTFATLAFYNTKPEAWESETEGMSDEVYARTIWHLRKQGTIKSIADWERVDWQRLDNGFDKLSAQNPDEPLYQTGYKQLVTIYGAATKNAH